MEPTVEAVLNLIQPDGAMPDTPGGTVVNADSNFLYLLTGLAHQARRRPALWGTVEQGLRWLSRRRWTALDPLPGSFPDALPLQGAGIPMGSPPTAAVGATSARFVGLVAELPHPPSDLIREARAVWRGLLVWNWIPGKGLRNAWVRNAQGSWMPREVWYAADQADYEVGRRGARTLGLSPCPRVPWTRFSLSRLALDAQGRELPLTGPERVAALAVLAFDGPRTWHAELLHELVVEEAHESGFIVSLAARMHLRDSRARGQLLDHLRRHPLPLDRDREGSPAYAPVAGFVLRAFDEPTTKGEHHPVPATRNR